MEQVISTIAKAIKGSKYAGNSYIVGGFVRDRIMGKSSNDLDIVVAVDKGGIGLAERLYRKGVSSHPVIFKNFGTAFVLMENYKVEFVMSRQESYRVGSRKPDVKAGTLEDDIFRRDFTINSLLMNISSGEIIDITGKGKDDIKAKIIRATSEVNKLFTEDPLRMIRAVRFSTQLGFKIEEKTLAGIRSNSDKLSSISWERRRDEFQKILLTQSPVTGIRMLLDLNLMENIIPEFLLLDGMKQNKYHYLDGLEHTLEVLKRTSNNLIVRLAAILHDIGKPIVCTEDSTGIHFYNHDKVGADLSEQILRRLRFPLESVKRVKKLILNHMRLKNSGIKGELISDKGIRRLLLEMNNDFELLLELISADNAAHAEQYRSKDQVTEILRRASEIKINLTKPELPLKGRDIIDYFGIKPGKAVGDLLIQAEDIWLGHPQFDKEVILKELKKNQGGNDDKSGK